MPYPTAIVKHQGSFPVLIVITILGGGWLDVTSDGDVLYAGHGGGPGLAHAAGLGQAGALPRPRLRVQQAGGALAVGCNSCRSTTIIADTRGRQHPGECRHLAPLPRLSGHQDPAQQRLMVT